MNLTGRLYYTYIHESTSQCYSIIFDPISIRRIEIAFPYTLNLHFAYACFKLFRLFYIFFSAKKYLVIFRQKRSKTIHTSEASPDIIKLKKLYTRTKCAYKNILYDKMAQRIVGFFISNICIQLKKYEIQTRVSKII